MRSSLVSLIAHPFVAVIGLVSFVGCVEPPSEDGPLASARRDASVEPERSPVDPDDGEPHLWVLSPWSVDAVHEPAGPAPEAAERWFFGPLEDVARPPGGPLLLALGSGAIVVMDASLAVSAVVTKGLGAPRALAADHRGLFVADAERGLLVLDPLRVERDAMPLVAERTDLRPSALALTHGGLAAVVEDATGVTIEHVDAHLRTRGQWRLGHVAAPEDVQARGDALYVVDGGACVRAFQAPETFRGDVAPYEEACSAGRRFHAVEVDDDGVVFVAHDDGVDVFDDLDALYRRPAEPAQVLVRDDWPRWDPKALAVGRAH